MEILSKIAQAFSKLRSFRLYSVINILGLALSLACTMFFAMYIHREYSADSFHSKIDDIYAITCLTDQGMELYEQREGVLKDGENFFLEELPEISKKCRVIPYTDNITVKINGIKQKQSSKILNVDSTFFNIFDFTLTIGDPKKVLKAPKSAIIKQSFAKKIFPNINPIGQTFSWNGIDIIIEGIANDNSYISAIDFDILVNTQGIQLSSRRRGVDFLLFEENASVEALREKITMPKYFKRYGAEPERMDIVPLKGLYLNSSIIKSDNFRSGDKSSTRVLNLAALIVLVIGVFNFINIQSVTTIKRGKELGIKKVFGASKGSMFLQFYIEDLIMVMASTFTASLLVELIIPLAQKWLSITLNHIWSFDALLIGSVVFILPLLTALIPYIKYTYSMPVNAIKDIGVIIQGRNARNIFIILQNIMTVVMVVTAIYFILQFKTMLNTDIGFNTENLLVVEPVERGNIHVGESWDENAKRVGKYQQSIDDAFSATPAIHSYYSGASLVQESWLLKFKLEGEEEFKKLSYFDVNKKTLETYGLELIDGNFFDEFLEMDYRTNKVVISESALKYLGITGDWKDAVLESERPLWYTSADIYDQKKYQIIGVVKDIRTQKLSEPSRPLLFKYSSYYIGDPITIRYQEGKKQEVITTLEDVFKNTSGAELKYTTVTQILETRYVEEKRAATTYSLLALIAILISSMGLFGLSFFDVQQKYREIALRKVNGATIADILKLLSIKYIKLLSVSFIIAIPTAYWAIMKYTADFIVKAPLAWWIFLIAMLVTALVSMLTLWWQTLKAAKENPAIAMKRE